MLLGPNVGADVEEWERMIAINQNGPLYMTNAALPRLLAAAKDGQREMADIVNISSIAGRQAWANYGVYNVTKFGVNGFTEALRQEVTKKHVRGGALEPQRPGSLPHRTRRHDHGLYLHQRGRPGECGVDPHGPTGARGQASLSCRVVRAALRPTDMQKLSMRPK